MLTTSQQQSLFSSLPDAPGVYRYYTADGELIYVGKAKNLKKRIKSYYTSNAQHNRKTRRLVSEIARVECTLSETEYDALLLENNLIKENRPKYNILLRDDKTFPFLCILREPFPRLVVTRKHHPKTGEYFGPYTSLGAMKSVLELVRNMFSIRTCSWLLSKENIKKKKYKLCLEYHLKNCKGPCQGLQEETTYLNDIEQARKILNGNLTLVKTELITRMKAAAKILDFEQAEQVKQKINLLARYRAKSPMVNLRLKHVDVSTITSTDQEAYVNYMHVKDGAIVFSVNQKIVKKLQEKDEDILSLVVEIMRQQYRSTNSEILTNCPITVKQDSCRNVVPKIGDKKKLIDLSLKNVLFNKHKNIIEKQKHDSAAKPILLSLQRDLGMTQRPEIIECFDNSNLQGSNPVAAMVRFVQGKPYKKEYRHYTIKTVEGPDDFASMKEIIFRRYRRLLTEKSQLPNLIIVDGGKGQLSSAHQVLKELELYPNIPIIGIAKRLEEVYRPEDPTPLFLPKNSPSLQLIQRIRDEAHRFAITFHRKKRSRHALTSQLDNLPGVGPKTREALWKQFKSMQNIKKASLSEIAQIIGKKKSEKLWAELKKTDSQNLPEEKN